VVARAIPRLAGSVLTAALLHAVATGCGGQSLQRDDGGDAGGTAGTGAEGGGATGGAVGTGGDSGAQGGASGTGATPGAGGSPVTGGTGAGGTPVTGGTGGISGTGNASGTGGGAGELAFCFLDADPGPCRASMGRWAFDAKTGLCLPFVYGGCSGNENNFETIERCYETCNTGAPSPADCGSPVDCMLMRSRCCGCDALSLANVVAVNKSETAAVQRAMGCDLLDCVTCEADSPPTLGATCTNGHCIAFDVTQTEFTRCMTDDQCSLRAGLACCENCAADIGDYVALSSDPRALVCGNTAVACDACVPVPPLGVGARCADGRCAVVHPPD
jgi:hypothetical protein